MATYPTQDKEAMLKTETAILKFIKTLTIGLTETKPEIFYTETHVEKCRAEILNALEKLGYIKLNKNSTFVHIGEGLATRKMRKS